MLFSALNASASPTWMRYNTISPNGKQIAFSYKGDIYIVNSKGGVAKQITTTADYEYMPIFSPDNKSIAFATNRNGSFDIYIVSVEGGEAQRVTTNSVNESPLAFSKDGKSIIYSAYMQKSAENVQFPSGWITELYSIPTKGGRPTQIVSNPVMNLSLDKNGKSFIYENRTGSENIWRKHHVSSVARDIYQYNAENDTHKKLTTNVGEDRNPIYTPDGEVLFLSERDGGSFNIYLANLNNMDNPKALTKFKEHPVRFLSQAKDGTICFGYHGDIYTMKQGQQPKKIDIAITNDTPTQQMSKINVGGGGSMAMTPSGDQIIYVSRGEIFATTDEYPTTKRITNTAAAENGVTISPDGRTIIYSSERDGKWELYSAEITREQEVNFANATLIKEEKLFKSDSHERLAPQFSPDGKELAFIQDRNKLMVMDIKTKKVRQVTDGSKHIENGDRGFYYQWSPDSKWFVMNIVTNIRAPYSDIAIVSAQGGGEFHNITESAYIDVSPRWVLNGDAILYVSNRYGMRSQASWGSQNDIFLAFLNQKAYDDFNLSKEEKDLRAEEEKLAEKAKKESEKDEKNKKDKKNEESQDKSIEIEFNNISDRIVRLTPMSGRISGGMVDPKGEKLYFFAAFEKSGSDLWELNIKSRAMKAIKKGVNGGRMVLSEDGKSLYILGSSSQKVTLASGSSTPIRTSTTMTFDRAAEREYMFNHVFLQQSKRFYKEDYHGVDLKRLKSEYIKFLPHINNNYDFAEMLSEILGELNVSHTGSGYRAPTKDNADATADLGILYDLKYTGDGLKVDEIIEGSPFDKRDSKLKAGMIIEKIDGVEIKKGEDYFVLLNNKRGLNTLISIYNPVTKERWEEVVKPISQGRLSGSMYDRWVKSRQEETERLSGGRLGYVHIRSMDDGSYRTIYNDILGKYNRYDGVIIDTRFNGGGRLHEDVEILFSGEKYLEQYVRGVHYGDMPSRRYNKPSIMITGEANYSNAHGTPWVYQKMGIGKLVGMPVPGTMTSVSWETLQDPTLYFGIPVVGYRTKDGEYLENYQLEPDYKVVNTPEKLNQGSDEQLEFAVKELLKQIDAEKGKW